MTARRQPYKPLLEKARRYIRSAQALQELSDYDSAVSRLYYAMFYCAELLVFTKGLIHEQTLTAGRPAKGETLFDFLSGYVGTVSGTTEALSENCGQRFAQGLVEKRQRGCS